MSRVSVINTNFTAGELSEDLFGRVDITKYQNGAATLENFIVQPHGGVTRRPGTRFIKEVKVSSALTRLFPFEFSTTQAYVIEFGNLYIRFYKDEGAILEANVVVSGATAANPCVVTANSHGYANGDEVYINSVVGMTELNGKYYKIKSKTTNTFALTDIDDTNINSSSFTAYSSAGTVARVYTVTTTYTTADIPTLQFAQSADVLYVAHPSYTPRKITRTAHTSWTISDITYTDGPYQDENITTTTLTPSHTSGSSRTITASAVGGINGGDGFQATDVGRLISIGHQAAAWAASTAYAVGDVKRNSGNVYECLKAGDSAGSGGPSGEGDEIVDDECTWKFLRDGGIQWGYATVTARTNTTVVTVTVNATFGGTTAETKWRLGAWSGSSGYPATVAFFEQRLFWAGSTEQPQTLWGSKSGDYENHTPGTLDNDALIYTLATDQVNVIRWLSPGKVMAIGTVGGEFTIAGSTTADPLTPTNVRVVREGTRGSHTHTPIRVDNVVLFIQRQQRKLREFAYTFESDSFQSPDLTILSNQVSKGGIKEVSFQQEPSTVVWGVKADGQLIGMTYLRDQKVVAWHRHKLGGSFSPSTSHGIIESLAVIPGSGEDQVFMIVKRTVNGSTRRYIEFIENQFDTEESQTKDDAFFVDSGLTLNNPITITAATKAKPVVVTAAGHGFSDGDLVDIENVLGMTELNNNRYTVIEKTTNTFELMNTAGKPVSGATQASPGSITCVGHGFVNNDQVGFLNVTGMVELNGNAFTATRVDANTFTIGVDSSGYTAYTSGGTAHLLIDSAAFTTYSSSGSVRQAVGSISGLDHLEGQSVSILGNGSVYANKTVASGAITGLSPEVSKCHIGLGSTATIKTLRPEAGADDGAAQGKTKRIFDATVRFKNTLGAKVGPNTTDLDEINFRGGSDPMDSSPPLFSGDKNISFRGGWETEGQVVIVQDQPLPSHITAIMTRLITNDG